MAEAPLFSIVIPCFNYGHWLERAVNSVLAQEGDDWELLVIDDGSTDTTAQVAEALLDRHPGRLRFLSQPNRGVAATRNRGIDETRGRYLIFLDADDELAPTALDSYRQLLERSPEADLLAGTHQVVTPDGRTKPCPVGRLPADHRRRFKTYLEEQPPARPLRDMAQELRQMFIESIDIQKRVVLFCAFTVILQ